jgi:hypothetical protein
VTDMSSVLEKSVGDKVVKVTRHNSGSCSQARDRPIAEDQPKDDPLRVQAEPRAEGPSGEREGGPHSHEKCVGIRECRRCDF